MSNNRGCWFAISRCFNSKAPDERTLYSKVSMENIEFEDLSVAEQKAAEAKRKKQVVTDLEREHVMNGKLDDLVEHQRRMDEERDAQLKRQEEALRKEEEAYYAAKREAANKRASQMKVPVSLEIEQSDQSDVGFSFPSLPVPMQPSTVASVVQAPASVGGRNKVGGVSTAAAGMGRAVIGGHGPVGVIPSAALSMTDPSVSQQKDDDDFDQFLESVKVKQLSITTKSPPSVPEQPVTVSDSEEEIDFGYWEKAPVPSTSGGGVVTGGGVLDMIRPSSAPETTSKHLRPDQSHEVDLGLL